MKKIISFLTSLILVLLCVAVPVTAEEAVFTETVSDKAFACSGETVTFTVVVPEGVEVKSGAVDLTFDDTVFEIVSTEWMVEDTFLETFDLSTNKGAFAFTSAQTINGGLFSITFRILENAPRTTVTFGVNVQLKCNNVVYTVSNLGTDVAINCAHETLQEYVHDNYKVSDATCTSPAIYNKSCVVCGTKAAQTFEFGVALGHDIVAHPAQDPTCEVDGWEAYETCTRCDYTTFEGCSALGHDIVRHTAQAPTCTAHGWEAYETCSRCPYTTYVEIPELGHEIIFHVAQAPTCTAHGWEAYMTCSRCAYTTHIEIPALGHVESDWIVDREPTVLLEGTQHKECLICGEILETGSIDRLPFDQGDDDNDDNDNQKPGDDDTKPDDDKPVVTTPVVTKPNDDKPNDDEPDDEKTDDETEGELQAPVSGCGNVKVTISEASVLPIAFIAAAAFRFGKKKKDE